MSVFEIITAACAAAIGIAILPGSVYLLLLTIAALRRATPAGSKEIFNGRIAVIVPAHNEAGGIARTVANLASIADADGNTAIYVVADNCSDETADVAARHGANVLVRHNPEQRGKGYALDFAFSELAGHKFDAYIVIDADSIVSGNFMETVRGIFGQGADAVQARYSVLNTDESPRTRIALLALSAFNYLRPRGRHALGLSAGILGNGFGLRAHVLDACPYTSTSVVEDLEYHLTLVDHGYRVAFADNACVFGDMPASDAGQCTQRARWEGGRLRMLREHGWPLTLKATRGKFRFIEPLGELLTLPLSYHGMLLCILTLMPYEWAGIAGTSGLAIIALHVLIAARKGGVSMIHLIRIIGHIPGYLLWKLRMVRSIAQASKATAHWVRTNR